MWLEAEPDVAKEEEQLDGSPTKGGEKETVKIAPNLDHDRSVKLLLELPPNAPRRPLLSPLLPVSGFFRAKILHLDSQGVIWVVPNDHIKLLAMVTTETSNCRAVKAEDQVDTGKLFLCQTARTLVRARILEVKEGEVVYQNVDSGELGQSRLRHVFATPPSLLRISPLAIPLKLYGLKWSRSQPDWRDLAARMLEEIPRSQVTVSLLEPGLRSSFPIPAIIRYSSDTEAGLESNLALTLLDQGLVSVITSHTDWTREIQLSGLDWLNLSSHLPLSHLPHPFPLAEGLWLEVTVQGVYYPLDEEEPTIQCPHANRVSCHLVPLSRQSQFNLFRKEISRSSQLSEHSLESLELAFQELSEKLGKEAGERGGSLKDVRPGDGVLVSIAGEWCRARVVMHLEDKMVQVYYPDYGHYGKTRIKDLRVMKERSRLEPLQVKEFSYQMPETNQVKSFLKK